MAVCQDSKVFLMLKEPLLMKSMTLELSNSMGRSKHRACFAMFDPLAHGKARQGKARQGKARQGKAM